MFRFVVSFSSQIDCKPFGSRVYVLQGKSPMVIFQDLFEKNPLYTHAVTEYQTEIGIDVSFGWKIRSKPSRSHGEIHFLLELLNFIKRKSISREDPEDLLIHIHFRKVEEPCSLP